MSTPHVEQVGGNHYAGGYQHWDYCDDADVPHLESAASKYIARWYKKNGIQDLQKSISYIDKRLASNYLDLDRPPMLERCRGYGHLLLKYYQEAEILPWEQAVSNLILMWEDYSDLEYAKNLILAQIKHEETKQGIKHE